jgi:pimeloyl-ACP methyl ester carboxylesterase
MRATAIIALYMVLGAAAVLAETAAPSGRLVMVNGRQMHIFCEGTGKPTVVIEAGGGTPSKVWRTVQDQIANFAHVCAYDRAGLGSSDPSAKPQSISDRADDLYAVLMAAGEAGPYVLISHSYGGFIARTFQQKHKADVVGMVLVDAAEEGVVFTPATQHYFEQAMAEIKQQQEKVRSGASPGGQTLDNLFSAMQDENASYQLVPANMRRPGGFGTLDNLPLIVIMHGKPFVGDAAVLEPPWQDGQKRLSGLSSRSQLLVAENSDHDIEVHQPGIIVDAARQVLAKISSTP